MRNKPTLKSKILSRFRYYWREQNNPWINAGAVERFALENGYKGSTASRELRWMIEDNLLERTEMKLENSRVASVYYKYIPT